MDKFDGDDNLVIQKLSIDFKRALFFDEAVSCGTGARVGYPFRESVTMWEHFLKQDDNAFIVESYGDSMVEAGIDSGDRVTSCQRWRYCRGSTLMCRLMRRIWHH